MVDVLLYDFSIMLIPRRKPHDEVVFVNASDYIAGSSLETFCEHSLTGRDASFLAGSLAEATKGARLLQQYYTQTQGSIFPLMNKMRNASCCTYHPSNLKAVRDILRPGIDV